MSDTAVDEATPASGGRDEGPAPRYTGRHRGDRSFLPWRRRRRARRPPPSQNAASGGAILVARFAVTSVLNYAFGIALVWLLAEGDFATVSVLQNVLLLGALVLGAGFPWVLARGGATADRDEDYPALFRGAVLGNLALAVVLAAGLIGAQVAGFGAFPSDSPWVVVGVVLMLPLTALLAAFGGALQGLRRFSSEGVAVTLEIAVKLVVGLVLVGVFRLGATGVALGFLAGAAGAVWYGRRALHDQLPGRGPVAASRSFRLALPMWVSTSAFGLLATVDVIALGMFSHGAVPVAAIAAYQVAAILGRAMYYVADAFIDATFPFMAAAGTLRGSHDWFRAALRCIPLLVLPTQLALLVAPEPIVALLFPSGYADVGGIVRILDLGTLGLILTAWYNKALFAQGRGDISARWVPVGAVVEVVALAVLVPLAGAEGAAVAFVVGSWTAALPLAWAYARLHSLGRPALRPALRHTLALLAMVPLLLLARTVPAVVGVALLAVALAVHLGVARLLGVIDRGDVDRLRSAVDRRLPPALAGRLRRERLGG